MTEPAANRDTADAALTPTANNAGDSTLSPLITIRVGENIGDRSKHFFVQQNILCKTSEYMQAHCKPEWSQDSAIIHLPNTTAQAFDLYVDWLYRGVVCPSKYAELEETSKAYFVLGTAYVLGEYLQDSAFRDAIIDSLYRRCEREETQLNTAWLVDIISVIYNGTTDGSGARQFVTDLCIVKTVSVELWDHSEDLPKDFFRDLARKYHVFEGYEETHKRWREPKCHYHSHHD